MTHQSAPDHGGDAILIVKMRPYCAQVKFMGVLFMWFAKTKN